MMNLPSRRVRLARPVIGVILVLVIIVVTATVMAVQLTAEATPTQHASAGASLADLTASLDSQLVAQMTELDVPGAAVGLVSAGEVTWSAAYGRATGQPTRPMRVDTIFRAESISKSVTAWGVLRLVDGGLVDLDVPVARYLQDGVLPVLPEGEVTVRELLTHTAGLPLGTIGVRYAPDAPRPSLLDDLRAEVRVESPPGTSFSYSNVGYNLLELMVEHVTGQDFADYMDREVLGPLGMESSTFSWPEESGDLVASGHRSSGEPVPPYVYAARASGGLHTTVEDVAHFVAAGSIQQQESNPVLSAQSLGLAHEAQVAGLGIYGAVADGYAFGHFTEVLADGRTAVWHGGQGTGWMTHFHLVPESGDGIVILTNSQRSWPLISAVVADWATWSGVGPVQLSRISQANSALRVALVVWALALVVTGVTLVARVRTGARRFAPLASDTRLWRLSLAVVSAASLAGVAWAARQPYLMVSSLLPSLVLWLAVAVTLTALLALCAAVIPRHQDG